MARRQAVLGQGREVHLGRADRQGRREVRPHPQEPAQGLVQQSQGRHRRVRHRGDLRAGTAAALVPVDAGRRLLAGLRLPCQRPRHALQADRHRPVQGRRLQAQRIDQAGAQSRLLEEGPPLPRRHRLEDRAQPQHAHAWLRRRRVRHDVRLGRHVPHAERRQGAKGRCRLQGASMLPPPAGFWGMPKEMLETLPGQSPDREKNLAEARKIMTSLGYGPDKPLKIKVSTRNIAIYRDPAVILIDQLKQIYVDGELEPIDTTVWYTKIQSKKYTIGLNLTGLGVDDPDTNFYENFHSTSDRNYTGYKNPEVDKMIEQQSGELDRDKRKKLVWEMEKKLAEDGARPVINHNVANTCWTPQMKGLVLQVNSIYNGWRFEDVWLDR